MVCMAVGAQAAINIAINERDSDSGAHGSKHSKHSSSSSGYPPSKPAQVRICHQDDNGAKRTMEVSNDLLPIYLQHGGKLGACQTEPPTTAPAPTTASAPSKVQFCLASHNATIEVDPSELNKLLPLGSAGQCSGSTSQASGAVVPMCFRESSMPLKVPLDEVTSFLGKGAVIGDCPPAPSVSHQYDSRYTQRPPRYTNERGGYMDPNIPGPTNSSSTASPATTAPAATMAPVTPAPSSSTAAPATSAPAMAPPVAPVAPAPATASSVAPASPAPATASSVAPATPAPTTAPSVAPATPAPTPMVTVAPVVDPDPSSSTVLDPHVAPRDAYPMPPTRYPASAGRYNDDKYPMPSLHGYVDVHGYQTQAAPTDAKPSLRPIVAP